MSFRRRLTVFFVLLVIVPMASVAFVLFGLIDDSEDGRADARLASGQQVAVVLFDEARARAEAALGPVGADRRLAGALQRDDLAGARRRARALLAERGLTRLALVRDGRAVLDVGSDRAVAVAAREIVGSDGTSFGELQVSVQPARAYALRVRELIGLDVAVVRRGAPLAVTLPAARGATLPAGGDAELGGAPYRVGSFPARDLGDQRVRVTLLALQELPGQRGRERRGFTVVVLLGFFVLAVTCALAVSRSLQQQVAALLHGARRLGAGDLSARVPTRGGDEFAALGEEFNRMAGQLEARLEDLRLERERVQHSVRRLGQALASNLDRRALLEIVVQTAVEGVGASAGRAIVRPVGAGHPAEQLCVGSVDGLDAVMRGVEDEALVSLEPRALSVGEVSAMAHPLRESDGRQRVVGVVCVGRAGRRFSPAEEELFNYLAAQAGVSMENVELHETAARESVTDELTGLSNRRRFDDALREESERARRFGHPVGLVLLDIDDFKLVNDTHGHQQGDVVLREVARVLGASCREIDEVARYGGEELAVVLPETELEGAHNLAERVRQGVGALRVELPSGGEIQVTVSCGVAALPESADGEHDLFAAADAALYEAKRAGKDLTVRARRMAAAGPAL
jgi:diguanylate cyclase (GGDEF)-like protein